MPRTPRKAARDVQARDRRLAAAGVPLCPRCGERDRVVLILAPSPRTKHRSLLRDERCGKRVPQAWCWRCLGFVAALVPRAGRHAPDF